MGRKNRKDYWFLRQIICLPCRSTMTTAETCEPYIYTEGKGLTLTFDSIVSELLEASENPEEGSKVYSLQWNVYGWDENGEQTEVAYIETSVDGNSITLKKGKEGIDRSA